MNWDKGYSSQFYATVIDPVTWRDAVTWNGDARFEILSGSVSRNAGGLQESADILCREFESDGESWIRIYMDTRQEGEVAHVPIFTGLATAPEVNIDGNVTEYPLQCYSVLQPAEDIPLQRGWYAPAEANGAELAKLLLSVIPAPIDIDGVSADLTNHIVAEDKETHLSMACKILDAVNYRIRISGDGAVLLMPKNSPSTATRFSATENDAIEPRINLKRDWFKCPNVYSATMGDSTVVVRDDDPDSMFSTVNRGREVWYRDTNVSLPDNESLVEYAWRRLKEEQNKAIEVGYNRRYIPDLCVGDFVRLHYPQQGIEGVYRITSQGIQLGYSCSTAEDVVWAGAWADGMADATSEYGENMAEALGRLVIHDYYIVLPDDKRIAVRGGA